MVKEDRELNLSERLLRYSAVASLTAASALALGPGAALADPAVVEEPEVTLTPPFATYGLDFDQNGTDEFVLSVTWTAYTTTYSYNGTTYTYSYSGGWIDARSFAQYVSFLGNSPGTPMSLYPKVLDQGALISSGAGTWGQPQNWATLTTYGTAGYWLGQDGTEKKYLGVRYQSGGQTRYGWVELTCTSQPNGGPELIIHRYGHNTTAGAGIPAAVQAKSLKAKSGLRAAGAAVFAALAGVFAWLRCKVARE